jgi:hypothetical protein
MFVRMGTIEIGGLAFALAFWAVVLWGSIRVIDRSNTQNSFGAAMAWSVLQVIAGYAMQHSALGIFFLAAWLVFMLRLLTQHYHLNLLGAIIVTISTAAVPYYAIPVLVRIIGDNDVLGLAVLFGFPVVVFGVWLVPGYRARRSERDNAPEFPTARVEQRKRATTAPTAPTAVAAVAPAPQKPVDDSPNREPTLLS